MDAGYLDAPDGNFSAISAGLLLKYYFSAENKQNHQTTWRLRLNNTTYFDPLAEDGTINPTMQLLGFSVDYFLSRYFYVTGQTAFAYIGNNTGGYFSGLLGVGGQTNNFSTTSLSAFSEILVGTAGGAGLSIGDGALAEPLVGLQYAFTKTTALQTSVGYLMAVNGNFRSVVLGIGLGFMGL